jgi:hypothetical protein
MTGASLSDQRYPSGAMAVTDSASAPSSASAPTTHKSLSALLRGGARYPEISSYLDGLSVDRRLEEVLSITHGGVRKLYQAVADAPPFPVEDFLPPGTKDGEVVIYEGRNSLPTFTRFQKRFCRKGNDIVGFNHQWTAFAAGPGWFVANSGDDTHPGELLFDYTLPPPFFPAEFAPYKPNEQGLSRLIFAHMKDYCRRVAKGVLVGTAFKKGKAQNAYFTLTLPR